MRIRGNGDSVVGSCAVFAFAVLGLAALSFAPPVVALVLLVV